MVAWDNEMPCCSGFLFYAQTQKTWNGAISK